MSGLNDEQCCKVEKSNFSFESDTLTTDDSLLSTLIVPELDLRVELSATMKIRPNPTAASIPIFRLATALALSSFSSDPMFPNN